MMQSNLKVWTQRWERITSAQILSKLFGSVPANALYLFLDVIQFCEHATADAINKACEVKGKQARCPELLRLLQSAQLKLPDLQSTCHRQDC